MGGTPDFVSKRLFGKAAIGLGVAMCLALPIAVAAFPVGPRLLVMVAPNSPATTLMRAVRAADGRLVSAGRFEWIALVSGEGDDFAARLKAAGAWLVLDGSLFKGCETVVSQMETARGRQKT